MKSYVKTLVELSIDESFYPASKEDKTTPIWKVMGEPVLVGKRMMRSCLNLKTNKLENKMCSLSVIQYTYHKR